MPTDYYIDLNAASGLGAQASPFSFAQAKAALEAMSGPQSSDNYFFKKGSSAAGIITIFSANTFNIGTYGAGARPVIDGSTLDFALDIADVFDVDVRGMHLKGAKEACLRFDSNGVDLYNVGVYDCEASDAIGGAARDGFLMNGRSSIVPSTGMRFIGNVTNNNDNNGLETSYMDGLIISGNKFNGDKSNAVEYWNQCVNCTQERNVVNGCGRIFWFADQSGTHSNNLIQNEIGYNLTLIPFKVEGADLTTIYNCTAHEAATTISGRQGLLLKTSTNTEMKNCVFYLLPSTNTNADYILWSDAGSVLTLTTDNNMYYEVDGTGAEKSLHRYYDGTTIHTTIAAWRIATGEDANSVEDDPEFTDAINGDLRLSETSPARYEVFTEAPGIVLDDANKDRRYGGIDIGALQFKRHADISASVSL